MLAYCVVESIASATINFEIEKKFVKFIYFSLRIGNKKINKKGDVWFLHLLCANNHTK